MTSQYQNCYRPSSRSDTDPVALGVLIQYQNCYYLLYFSGGCQ